MADRLATIRPPHITLTSALCLGKEHKNNTVYNLQLFIYQYSVYLMAVSVLNVSKNFVGITIIITSRQTFLLLNWLTNVLSHYVNPGQYKPIACGIKYTVKQKVASTLNHSARLPPNIHNNISVRLIFGQPFFGRNRQSKFE